MTTQEYFVLLDYGGDDNGDGDDDGNGGCGDYTDVGGDNDVAGGDGKMMVMIMVVCKQGNGGGA